MNRQNLVFRVPVGDSKNETQREPPPEDIDAPEVKHLQGRNNFCLGCSFASGIHHWMGGNTKLSSTIFNCSKKLSLSVHSYDEIIQILEKNAPQHQGISIVHPEDMGEIHNVLGERSEHPTLCVLKGDDGNCSHCVCTVGEWVFDSNFKKARRISKEILDWCVSSDDTVTEFVGVLWSIRLLPSTPRHSLPDRLKDDLPRNTVHASLAELFTMMNQHTLAQWFLRLAPVHCTRKNSFQGFFGINGLFFQKDVPLHRWVQLKKMKKCKFENSETMKLVTFVEGSGIVGAVLIGCWLFDLRGDRPRHVSSHFLSQHRITKCYQLNFINEQSSSNPLRKSYDDFLQQNPVLKIK